MDNLTHDPEIGPALIGLLTKIISNLREENVGLRKELAAVKGEELVEREEATEVEEQLRRLCLQSGNSASLSVETNRFRRQDSPRDYSPPTSEPESDCPTGTNSDNSDNEERANTSSRDFPSPIREWATQPCLPRNMSPNGLPKRLRCIMCEGGSLYWSGERCSVNILEGTYIIYSCTQRYKCWVADEERRWTTNSLELADLSGQRRELFYKLRKKEICYAGTFEASSVVSDLEIAEYQNLSKRMRARLVRSAFLPAPLRGLRPTEEDKELVADKFWSGEIRVGCLQWKRVGFNRELFQRLIALREAGITDLVQKGGRATGSKRKPDEEHELPPQKRRKHDSK